MVRDVCSTVQENYGDEQPQRPGRRYPKCGRQTNRWRPTFPKAPFEPLSRRLRAWLGREGYGGAKASEDAAVKKAGEASGEAELYSDEYFAAQKAKRRGLGLIQFIGELYKLQMLTERIMHEVPACGTVHILPLFVRKIDHTCCFFSLVDPER
jgi:hypothetical protein